MDCGDEIHEERGGGYGAGGFEKRGLVMMVIEVERRNFWSGVGGVWRS